MRREARTRAILAAKSAWNRRLVARSSTGSDERHERGQQRAEHDDARRRPRDARPAAKRLEAAAEVDEERQRRAPRPRTGRRRSGRRCPRRCTRRPRAPDRSCAPKSARSKKRRTAAMLEKKSAADRPSAGSVVVRPHPQHRHRRARDHPEQRAERGEGGAPGHDDRSQGEHARARAASRREPRPPRAAASRTRAAAPRASARSQDEPLSREDRRDRDDLDGRPRSRRSPTAMVCTRTPLFSTPRTNASRASSQPSTIITTADRRAR